MSRMTDAWPLEVEESYKLVACYIWKIPGKLYKGYIATANWPGAEPIPSKEFGIEGRDWSQDLGEAKARAVDLGADAGVLMLEAKDIVLWGSREWEKDQGL